MPELIPAEHGTPEWHAARRQGVTATDIVKIIGLSTWASAYSLYWQKLGQTPETPDNDRFRLGRYLEKYVADCWMDEHDRRAWSGGLYRHSDRAWQMASPDRVIWQSSDWPWTRIADAVLEVKSMADADRPSWDTAPPPAVRAQVLWQMDVMDVGVGHVGVVFLPSGEFRSYVIEHDAGCDGAGFAHDGDPCDACSDLALMRERGAEFHARLQGDIPPPPVDASAATTAALKARFGDAAKGKRVPIDGHLWEQYEDASAVLQLSEYRKREAENQIREQLGEATEIEVDGQLVARRRVYDSPVKAHTRHVDGLWRVKQQGDDSE
jgi:putative phage-type endonuclease